ncbi:MAG: Mur ligase family protein [bacterium]
MDLRLVRDWLYGQWIAREIARFHACGGKVVMITGSYGKTSVRELTYDLLRQKYRVVETSRNYNTAVGIAKTLYWELTPTTQWLIVEVGAYRVGEIAQFAKWIRPEIGVITGIARQHLTRFGGWDRIKQAKTELVRYIQQRGGVLIANGSDETARELIKEARWYEGDGREEMNKNGARVIARACGMSEREIKRAELHQRQVPSRFEITTERYGMRVIDDSYNSNEKSFRQALDYLGKQKEYTRILVTPGLLELGSESAEIHEQLGKGVSGNTDLVILVGKNERTRNLEKGIVGKVKVQYIEKTLDFMKVVKNLKLKKEPLVLIENDIPEDLV